MYVLISLDMKSIRIGCVTKVVSEEDTDEISHRIVAKRRDDDKGEQERRRYPAEEIVGIGHTIEGVITKEQNGLEAKTHENSHRK